MKPGVYPDMKADIYHADPCPEPSLSSGIAKILLERSPRHAQAAHPRLNPNYESENAQEFDLGKAAHSVILGDPQPFVYIEADTYKTKAARAQRDDAYGSGAIPLLPKQARAVEGMAAAFKAQIAETEFGAAWDRATPETSVFVNDDGAWCRIRCDKLAAEDGIILDYKSIINAAPDNCVRQIFAMRWEVQNGFYRRVANKWFKPERAFRFAFIFQETEEPYCITPVELHPQASARADDRAAKAVHIWRDCVRADNWPGYPTRTCWAELPGWAAKQWEDEQLREEIAA